MESDHRPSEKSRCKPQLRDYRSSNSPRGVGGCVEGGGGGGRYGGVGVSLTKNKQEMRETGRGEKEERRGGEGAHANLTPERNYSVL